MRLTDAARMEMEPSARTRPGAALEDNSGVSPEELGGSAPVSPDDDYELWLSLQDTSNHFLFPPPSAVDTAEPYDSTVAYFRNLHLNDYADEALTFSVERPDAQSTGGRSTQAR